MTTTRFTPDAERILFDAYVATDLPVTYEPNDDTDRGASLTLGDSRLVMVDEYDTNDAEAQIVWGYSWATYREVPVSNTPDVWEWVYEANDGAPDIDVDSVRAFVAEWIESRR